MAFKKYGSYITVQPQNAGLRVSGTDSEDIVLLRSDIDSDVIKAGDNITVKDTDTGVVISSTASGGSASIDSDFGITLRDSDSKTFVGVDTDEIATVDRLNNDETQIQQVINGSFEIFDSDVQAAGNEAQTPDQLNNEVYVTSQIIGTKTLYKLHIDGPTIDTEAYDAIADHTTYLKVEVITAGANSGAAGTSAIYKIYQEPTWTPDSEVLLIYTQNQKLLSDDGVDLLGRMATNNDTDFTMDFSIYIQSVGAYTHVYDGTAGLVPGYTDTDGQRASKALFGDAKWKKVITELPPRIYFQNTGGTHETIVSIQENTTDELILHTPTTDISDQINVIDVGSSNVSFGFPGNIAAFPVDTDTDFVAVFKTGIITFANNTSPSREYDDLNNETVFIFSKGETSTSGTVANTFHHDYSFVGVRDEEVRWYTGAKIDELENDIAHNVYESVTTGSATWTYTSDPQPGNDGEYHISANTAFGGTHIFEFNIDDADGTSTHTGDNIAHLAKGHRIRFTDVNSKQVYRWTITRAEFYNEPGGQSFWALGLNFIDKTDGSALSLSDLTSSGNTLNNFVVSEPAAPSGFITNDGDTDKYVVHLETTDTELIFELVGGGDKRITFHNDPHTIKAGDGISVTADGDDTDTIAVVYTYSQYVTGCKYLGTTSTDSNSNTYTTIRPTWESSGTWYRVFVSNGEEIRATVNGTALATREY